MCLASLAYAKAIVLKLCRASTVELQWLEHLWDHENLFETGVVRANEGRLGGLTGQEG